MNRVTFIGIVLFLISIESLAQTICEPIEIYSSDSMNIYVVVDSQPNPIGGFNEYYGWINKNRNKRLLNKKGKETKKIIVEFIVHEDSSLSDFKIMKGLGDPYDSEAVNLIKTNPIKWNPGRCDEKKVKTKMILPINF